MKIRYNTIHLGGIWDDCIGEINKTGVVFFWGNSGNGKTSAVLLFCKSLCNFGRVLYISKEEKVGLSMQNAIRRCGLAEYGSKFQITGNMSMEELDEKLSKPKSPEYVVIDSIQYMQLTYNEYIRFKEKHLTKMLILVSHADGKYPEGRPARSIMYDADLKLWVEGYKVFSKGRFIGKTGEGIIYEAGALRYWNGLYNK